MRSLFISIVLTGCATSQPEVFKLEQGETVVCQRYAQRECGMHLMQCGDSESVEFECVKRVYYDRPSSEASMDPLPKKKEIKK